MNRKHLFYTFLIQNSRQRLNIFSNFYRKIEEIPHRNFFDRNSIYVKYHRNILSHFNIKLYFIYFSTILCHSDFICFAKPMRFQRDAVYFFVLNFFSSLFVHNISIEFTDAIMSLQSVPNQLIMVIIYCAIAQSTQWNQTFKRT